MQGVNKSYSVFEVEHHLLLADADMLSLKRAPAASSALPSGAIGAQRSSAEAIAQVPEAALDDQEEAAAREFRDADDVPKITLEGGLSEASMEERPSRTHSDASREAVQADAD